MDESVRYGCHLLGEHCADFRKLRLHLGGGVENALTPTTQGLGAVPRMIAGAGASGAGMTVGNATQRAMEGQNPVDIGGGELGANVGLGLGMSLIRIREVNGDPAFQRAWKARDAYINALTVSDRTAYELTKRSPRLSELMAREEALRQKLDAARGYEEQDPIKGQLLQNLYAQNAALHPAAAGPNAQPVAQATAGSGSGSIRASGNTGDSAAVGGSSKPPAGTTPTNTDGAGASDPTQEGTPTISSADNAAKSREFPTKDISSTKNEASEIHYQNERGSNDPGIRENRDIKTQGGAHKNLHYKGDGLDAHHIPADDISPLSRAEGPAIRMDVLDHRATESWGPSKRANAWRARQEELIKQGKFHEAQQMDIDDIRSKFGTKSDSAIQEMLEYTRKLPPEKLKPKAK